MNKSLSRAVFTLVGTTIGAGIFGVPFVIAKIGAVLGLTYLIILGLLVLLLNLMYGEVILRTEGDHQLIGYCKLYFGRWGMLLASIAMLISLYGVLLAYLIQVGNFLNLIFGSVSPPVYSVLFFSVAGVAVLAGLRVISRLETFLVFLIMVLIAAVSVFALPVIEAKNYLYTNPSNLILPYGVLLFALSGTTVIPEVEELLRKKHHKLSKAIVIGSIIPMIVYGIFALAVVGVSGINTSEDAISGLTGKLPPRIVTAGAVLGVLTMGTSFLTIGFILSEIWHRDFRLGRLTAGFLALFPPLVLLLVQKSSFITVLHLTGAFMGGFISVLICALYLKAGTGEKKLPAYKLNLKRSVVIVVALVFIVGTLASFV